MKIITLGIDLAKNVFAVHGVDEFGKGMLVRPNVRRDQLLELIATLPPCVIGMEACSGAHHWARAFAGFGHAPKLMAPKFVAPYRMSGRRGKNVGVQRRPKAVRCNNWLGLANHLAGAGTGGSGIGKMLAMRQPAALFTKV